MTLAQVQEAIQERATANRYAGWRHDACGFCGEPRMAVDVEHAREVARGHAKTCRGTTGRHLSDATSRQAVP